MLASACDTCPLQVLLPALQKLVELPEWSMWVKSLDANFPYPKDQQDGFIEQHRCE